jgi:glycosyltransferase involved in cell wall biosynthesis
MKILQIARHHWNYSLGGMEIYVKDLVNELSKKQIISTVLAFQKNNKHKIGNESDIHLINLPKISECSIKKFVEEIYLHDDLIHNGNYDIAHFHFFREEEYELLKIMKMQNIPSIFTYHLPAACCPRGNLMLYGKTVCNGKLDDYRCTSCRIQNRIKVPVMISQVIALLNKKIHKVLPIYGSLNKINYWKSTKKYNKQLQYFINNIDMAVSCSEWGTTTLKVNNIHEKKIIYIPQGLPNQFSTECKNEIKKDSDCIKIGYIGRISPEKGIENLIDAFTLIDDIDNIQLVIFGLKEEKLRNSYENKIVKKAKKDNRIKLNERISQKLLKDVYPRLDILAIPSICPETGPFVLWEALSFGLYIIASETIGHPKLLMEKNQGIIVAPNTINNWASTIKKITMNFNQLKSIQPKIRTMEDVTNEMVSIYHTLKGG